MSVITEAVEAWRNNEIGDTDLLRRIVSYPHWKFPISEEAAIETLTSQSEELPRIQLHTDEKGNRQLLLWSTPETYANWVKAAGTPAHQHFIDTTGAWIFSLPFNEAIDEILLDPLTPPGLYYRRQQFDELRIMAEAIHLEKDLADLRHHCASDSAIGRIRAYSRYVVAAAKGNAGQRLIIAPDHLGRAFAPIFTADDAARKFLKRAQADLQPGEELIWVELPGERVFQILSGLKLFGIVFNCEGPTEPVSFAAGFARVVLETV